MIKVEIDDVSSSVLSSFVRTSCVDGGQMFSVPVEQQDCAVRDEPLKRGFSRVKLTVSASAVPVEFFQRTSECAAFFKGNTKGINRTKGL